MKKTLTLCALMFFAVLCRLPQMQDGAQAGTVGTCSGGLSCVPGGGNLRNPEGDRRTQIMGYLINRKTETTGGNRAPISSAPKETPTRKAAATGVLLAVLFGGLWAGARSRRGGNRGWARAAASLAGLLVVLIWLPVNPINAGYSQTYSDIQFRSKNQELTANALSRKKRELLFAAGARSGNGNHGKGDAGEPLMRRLAAGGLSLAILLGGVWLLLVLCAKLSPIRPLMSNRYGRFALLGTLTALIFLAAWPWLNPSSQSGQVLARAAKASATAAAPDHFASALQIGGTGTTQIGGADYDAAGNLYVAGGFTGTVTFNTAPATVLAGTRDFDVFIAKYNAAGQCQWARQANGPASGIPANLSLDGALALAVDGQGNSYIGGGFVGALAFKNAAGQTVLTLNDNDADINFELFVAKYDTAGNPVWARGGMSGTPDDPEATDDLDAGTNGILDIAVDAGGKVYVAGGFAGTNFLGATVTNAGRQDALLARLDPATGNPIWVSQPDGASDDTVLGLNLDGAGNPYVVGIFRGDLEFPTSPATTLPNPDQFEDTFIAKYNANGQCLFARAMSDEDYLNGFHIAAGPAGEFYVVGMFSGIATIDGITIEDDSELMSAFLVKFNAQGVAEWIRVMSQEESDTTIAGAIAERIVVDGNGDPLIAGSFSDQIIFGGENPATQQMLVSLGDADQFVAKWNAAGDFQWAKQISATGDVSQNETYDLEAAPAEYIPYRLLRNRATGGVALTGDFSGTTTLDGFTLNAGANRHAFVATLGGGLQFYPLPQPVRLLETRLGFQGCSMPGNALAANNTLTLPALGNCSGIPTNAKAITGNITVVPQGAGFLTLFPSSASQPTVANSNFANGEITNNVFTVGLGNDGAFKIFSSATTHIIADVTGYYAPPGAGGLYFHPLSSPVRLLETRSGFSGCFAPGAPLNGTGNPNADPSLDFPLQGRSPVAAPCNSIPASAQVLVGNATSVFPGGGGYLTIYPSGGSRPTVASSNYAGTDVINGPFAVKLGADGQFRIFTLATTHLVVDILGYYSAEAVDANGAGLLFNPLSAPVRLLETRPGGPPLVGCTRTNAPIAGNVNATTHTQQARDFCGLPASAQAVVGNASVVNTGGAGFLTLFPGNLTTAPLVATSNYPVPATFGYNRHYFVGLSPADGSFKVLTQFTTDLILDASGYFAP